MTPDTLPFMIPIVGTIAGCSMIAIIVALALWHKTRAKELDMHREMRLREMEHERNIKQLELEIEKAKAARGAAAS